MNEKFDYKYDVNETSYQDDEYDHDYYHANMIDDKKEETELKKIQKENQKKLKPYYNRNQKYLNTFKTWHKNQNTEESIIKSHLTNIKQYINTYLNYYPEKIKMEDGMSQIEKYFASWLIQKYAWTGTIPIKKHIQSLKLFYKCMSENNYVSKQEYQSMCTYMDENEDKSITQADNYIPEHLK